MIKTAVNNNDYIKTNELYFRKMNVMINFLPHKLVKIFIN